MKTLVPLLVVLAVVGVGRASAAGRFAPGVPVRFAVSPKAEPPPRAVWVMTDVDARDTWPTAIAVASTDVGGDVVVSQCDGLEALVFIPAEHDTDVLAGPLHWPAASARLIVSEGRRRTIMHSGPAGVQARAWLDGRAVPDSWPRCHRSAADQWTCMGVPADARVDGTAGAMDHALPPVVTDRDGRFVIAFAVGAPVELRIGGAPDIVRRVPLPDGAEMIDLGTVSIGAPVVVSVSVALRSTCEEAGAGPLGRTGVSIVNAAPSAGDQWRLLLPEAGPSVMSANCGGRDAPLAPTMIEIPPDVLEWGVFLAVSIR